MKRWTIWRFPDFERVLNKDSSILEYVGLLPDNLLLFHGWRIALANLRVWRVVFRLYGIICTEIPMCDASLAVLRTL